MESQTIAADTAGFAASFLLAIALSMCMFGLAERIRVYAKFLWDLCPRPLTKWALLTGFLVPAVNIMVYFLGDLVGVDLRVGFEGDGLTPILASLLMIVITWWVIVAAVGLTGEAVDAAHRKAKRDQDEHHDHP